MVVDWVAMERTLLRRQKLLVDRAWWEENDPVGGVPEACAEERAWILNRDSGRQREEWWFTQRNFAGPPLSSLHSCDPSSSLLPQLLSSQLFLYFTPPTLPNTLFQKLPQPRSDHPHIL